MGHSAPIVNLGPLISRKLLELESCNLTHLYRGVIPLFGNDFFFSQRTCVGRTVPSVNLGPIISRKLSELES